MNIDLEKMLLEAYIKNCIREMLDDIIDDQKQIGVDLEIKFKIKDIDIVKFNDYMSKEHTKDEYMQNLSKMENADGADDINIFAEYDK